MRTVYIKANAQTERILNGGVGRGFSDIYKVDTIDGILKHEYELGLGRKDGFSLMSANTFLQNESQSLSSIPSFSKD
jgi:hypothetical protein